MARKGRLDEIFSKSLYADDATLYSVSYRDFENIVEVPLPEFVKLSENFTLIPQTRILLIRKNEQERFNSNSGSSKCTRSAPCGRYNSDLVVRSRIMNLLE